MDLSRLEEASHLVVHFCFFLNIFAHYVHKILCIKCSSGSAAATLVAEGRFCVCVCQCTCVC